MQVPLVCGQYKRYQQCPTIRNDDLLTTLISCLHCQLYSHPVISRFSLAHAKSHQDNTTKFLKLPFSAQLNVIGTRMATHQLKRQVSNESESALTNPLTPRHLPVEISFRNQVISSHYVSRLREDIGLNRQRTFLQNKYKWNDQSWVDIAWDSFHLCAGHTQQIHSVSRSKLVHNWLHLGRRRSNRAHIS